jgi:hypothetical protein
LIARLPVSSFQFDSTTAGDDLSVENAYLLQIAPIIGGHRFSYTSPIVVYPGAAIVDPHDIWQQTHFGQTEASGTAAPESDADADGLSNLIERALGFDPTQAEDDSAASFLRIRGLRTPQYGHIDPSDASSRPHL